MVVTKKIMELLKNEPRLNSRQIAEKTETNKTVVQITLQNLCKRGRVIRERVRLEQKTKSGPRNIFIHYLPM
jgi:predicted transcriptional regulator